MLSIACHCHDFIKATMPQESMDGIAADRVVDGSASAGVDVLHAHAFLQSDKRMSDRVKINILVIYSHEYRCNASRFWYGSDLSAPFICVTASAFMERLVDRLASCVWRYKSLRLR
jgi:hypothetical protein